MLKAFTGYLNARVMAIFRTSEVHQIALTDDSLLDKNGLNLSANDILPGNDHLLLTISQSFVLFTAFYPSFRQT
jgi:hypothetical protein